MERRELFKAIAATVAASGVVLENASVVQAESKVALAVIETDAIISQETARRIAQLWEHGIEGTPLAGTKAFVLSNGLKLTLIDVNGRVLNRLNELEA